MIEGEGGAKDGGSSQITNMARKATFESALAPLTSNKQFNKNREHVVLLCGVFLDIDFFTGHPVSWFLCWGRTGW